MDLVTPLMVILGQDLIILVNKVVIPLVVIEVEERVKVEDMEGKYSVNSMKEYMHIASTCYKLKNFLGISQCSQSQPFFSFIASNTTSSDGFWILNTRATYHLPQDSTNLGNTTIYPSHDMLQHGSVSAFGIIQDHYVSLVAFVANSSV